MKRSFNFRSTLVLFALLLVAMFFIAPMASAAGDVPTTPDLYSTLGQILAWIIASGIITTSVAYALTWLQVRFPQFITDNLRNVIQTVLVAMIVAGLGALANALPQSIMDTRLFDALVGFAGFVFNAMAAFFGRFKAVQHVAAHAQSVDSLKMLGVKVFLVIAVLALSAVAGLLTPTLMYAETYDQMVARMFTAKQTAHPEIWNACGANCVGDIQSGNNWWLKPLLAKINAKYPSYASPATLDNLTRYAIVRSNELAIRADSDCREGLIRDEASRGKWPTAAQFDKCKITQDWWVTQYANNVEQTRADFDVSPQVFKVNEWPPYWRASREFGGAY